MMKWDLNLKLNSLDSKDRQKLFIVFGIFGLAVIILFFSAFLKPQFARFLVMNREYNRFKAEVKNEEALIADEQRIKSQYENIKKQALLFEKRFPVQDEVSSLLGDFSRIAEASDVKILKIIPMEKKDSAPNTGRGSNIPYYEFPILIEANAGYHQCGVFVNKLESMDRFIKVDSIDIKGNRENPRSHEIRLEVITYVIK